MEEVWLSRFAGEGSSVHLMQFAKTPDEWHQPEIAKKWDMIRNVRRVVTGALELERAEKRIGSSLEAAPTVFVKWTLPTSQRSAPATSPKSASRRPSPSPKARGRQTPSDWMT